MPHGSNEDVTVNTVGSPVPGVEAKIIDSEERTLKTGEIGELVTKGYFVFDGFDNNANCLRNIYYQCIMYH